MAKTIGIDLGTTNSVVAAWACPTPIIDNPAIVAIAKVLNGLISFFTLTRFILLLMSDYPHTYLSIFFISTELVKTLIFLGKCYRS